MADQALCRRIDAYLQRERERILSDLKALVRIPSKKGDAVPGAMFGPEGRRAMEAVAALWKGCGWEARIHGDCHYATAYRPGDSACIGFFNHVDVVPEGGRWSSPPFEPLETSQYIIGRGAADNKNGVIASLYAVKALDQLQLPVRSQILLFAGGDEETGMTDIAAFTAEQRQPDFSFVVDSMFPVCNGEKGSLTVKATAEKPLRTILSFCARPSNPSSARVADEASAVLPASPQLLEQLERATAGREDCWYSVSGGQATVQAKGISQYVSEPEGSVNAAGILAGVLAACPALGEEDCAQMGRLALLLGDYTGQVLGIRFADSASGGCTCICREVSAQEGFLVLTFICCYCVSTTGAEVFACMESSLAANGWTARLEKNREGYYIPPDDPRIAILSQIYGEITGQDCAPQVIGGGTYAGRLRNAAGFGPTYPTPLPPGHGSAHNPNETLVIDQLLEAIKIYIMSILAIDGILHGA